MANTQVRGQPFYMGTTLQDVPAKKEGGPEKPWFKETASQTWVIGDLIYLDTNGTLAICTEDGTTHDMTSMLAGIALTAATGVTGTNVYFQAIRPDDIFCMNVYHGTLASAVTAQTQLGAVFPVKHVNSLWHVDIENAAEGSGDASGRVEVIDFPLRSPFDAGNASNAAIGDIYGLVLVRFLPFSAAQTGTQKVIRVLQLA